MQALKIGDTPIDKHITKYKMLVVRFWVVDVEVYTSSKTVTNIRER